MKLFLICVVAASAIFAGCGKATSNTSAGAGANAKRYALKGKVVSVDKNARTAVIEHEAIPDYMGAMTMPFPIHEDWVWDELAPGAEIRGELVVDSTAKDPYWLEKIGIVDVPGAGQPAPPAGEAPVLVGRQVPDLKLTDQDGKRFSLADLKGKTVAVTFIYRECPLPDFCIKMSRNFSEAALQIAADPESRDRFRLVSISFDPERDTPAKLKQYGIGYLGNPEKPDFTVWRLASGSDKEVRAVADFFGLKYEADPNDKTQFLHSLVTAIIGPDGRVKTVLSGNKWTTNDLLQEMKAAAAG